MNHTTLLSFLELLMNTQKAIVVLLFLALLPIGLRAQQSDSQPTEEMVNSASSPSNGQGPSLAFKSEKIRVNYLSAGIAFTGAYSDNALLSTTTSVSNFSYLVQPHLTFSLSTPRVDWQLNLGGGLIVNQTLSQNNRAAENVALDLRFRLSEHVNLLLSNAFTDTDGLFYGTNPGISGTGVGVVGQLNNLPVIPSFQRTLGDASLAELRYQFSPSSTVGVRGSYSFLDYPGSAANTQFGPLYDSQTYWGEAFYNYQISAKQSVEVALRGQRFEIQPSISATDIESLLLSYTVKPAPSVALSLFAGPAHFDTSQNTVIGTTGLFGNQQWTSAEGATFNWQGGHTSAAASFTRQVGGGGLSSQVTLQKLVDARLRRQLGGRQEVNGGFTYSENDPLVSGQSFYGLTSFLAFQQRLANSLVVLIGYARDRQALPNGQRTANANRAWVSVSYDFVHSFGR